MNKATITLLGAILGLGAACSSGKEDEPGTGSGASANAGSPTVVLPGTGAAAGVPGSTGSGGAGAGSNPGASCGPRPDDSGCVGEEYEGEMVPLDVYVMFDQSCSMSCPISRTGTGQCCTGDANGRIFPVREAMDLFLHDPKSAGIGFGLGYFGNMALGRTSCRPEDYSTPALPIATGQADSLVTSLDRAEPTGETPTGAALRGACSYVKEARHDRVGRSIAILLVTDGVPETPVSNCGASLADAVAAARDCALDPVAPTKIYVLGVGKALDNLNQIAQAGRTDKAYLVEGGDVAASMLAALNAIRGDAVIPCELQIPDPPAGGTLDFQRVNLNVCDADSTPQTTSRVSDASKCADGAGWYYDDPANPQRIVLCKASCDTVSVPGATLRYSVGCATRVDVR